MAKIGMIALTSAIPKTPNPAASTAAASAIGMTRMFLIRTSCSIAAG
jgi:hypothetical protein